MRDENGQNIAPTKDKRFAGSTPLVSGENKDFEDCLSLVMTGISNYRKGKSKYPQTDEGFEEFARKSEEYLDYIAEANYDPDAKHQLIPDVMGWCAYMGISRSTLFSYRQRGQQWEEFIDVFKTGIASIKWQLASTNRISPILHIFDSTNNFGYVNASEFKLQPASNDLAGARIDVLSDEEIEQLAAGYEQRINSEEH